MRLNIDPDINHHDYTAIIDDKSLARLLETLEDAQQKGARVINLGNNQDVSHEHRKLDMHLVGLVLVIWGTTTATKGLLFA